MVIPSDLARPLKRESTWMDVTNDQREVRG
jgi:hypothetical protein